MERNALLQLCNNWLCNSSCVTVFIPKPSSPQMHLVCRFQEHASAPPKGTERRKNLKVFSILHCPSTFSPSPCALKESNTSPGANPMLVNWDHLPIPAHSSYTFLFQNERVLRRPSGNETEMAFYFNFFLSITSAQVVESQDILPDTIQSWPLHTQKPQLQGFQAESSLEGPWEGFSSC